MKKKMLIILITIVVLISGGLIFAGNYFYNVAVVPGEKDFLAEDMGVTKKDKLYKEKRWFLDDAITEEWSITSQDDLKLKASYLPASKKTKRTVVISHGYMGSRLDMAGVAKMYHDAGYNVLVPDVRAHGDSEGDFVGFGYLEKNDFKRWVDKTIAMNGTEEEIVLHGHSMGAATVMMATGEKLPDNVKAIVEDCGYTSAKAELSYQLKELYNLPSFPLLPITSGITKLRAGYFFGQADPLAAIEKNKLPLLVVHGDKDDFVPTSYAYEIYKATKGPKAIYIAKGANHVESFPVDKQLFTNHVMSFLDKYVK
ncbi:alpha/beta hydrolase [Brochothrix thermosphacta]|uniref:alpha/beta hydrolase n=1 Tax=Brochothrix thermosphacta TaxID=2756 RepID=UPI00083F5385|nr:alpha/beta hydrolase [Brochothrix thermosphacta]ODJ61454.1 alpha/beta hydrolase [Brochothrix thermosphacta]ODJ68701.1 alpha/beta hydrolase [Brochothrix thermosphacta]SPN72915.1 putative cell surface hydrolase of the alpha/beta superfamily [Brochothrix thermosphacta]